MRLKLIDETLALLGVLYRSMVTFPDKSPSPPTGTAGCVPKSIPAWSGWLGQSLDQPALAELLTH